MTITQSKSVLSRAGWTAYGVWYTFADTTDPLEQIEAERYRRVFVEADLYHELGGPEQITVTIQSGDVHVRGWRNAWAVLRGRYATRVEVSADAAMVSHIMRQIHEAPTTPHR